MAKFRSPNCDCPGEGNIDITIGGGAEGHDVMYDIRPDGSPTERQSSFSFSCDAFTRKDSFGVGFFYDGMFYGGGLYGSGCIAGSGGTTNTIPIGATKIWVVVEPECDPLQTEPATSWTFTLVVHENRC